MFVFKKEKSYTSTGAAIGKISFVSDLRPKN
jgi:hypothetical protein